MKDNAIYRWLDDRLGISVLGDLASHKTVPVHRSYRSLPASC